MVALHVNNDFTGSTRVFANVIANANFKKVWINGNEGFVQKKSGVHYLHFDFGKWNFIFVNLIVFVESLLRKREDVYYCSTSLSFGLGLVGWLKGSRVVLHKHEVGLGSSLLYKVLSVVWHIISPDVIAVSNYCLHNGFKVSSSRYKILYNPNPFSGLVQTKNRMPQLQNEFCVIMPSSCRAYKGVNLFIDIARLMPNVNFILALSAIDHDEISQDYSSLPNLSVFVRPNNLDELYSISHVVLNLSNPDYWIETFGMTLVEGMSFGCIPIASNIGGPKEIIQNGVNGILIDEYSISSFCQCIGLLQEDVNLRLRLSMNARKDSEKYSLPVFKDLLNEFLKV